jgi:hypothetical protein
MKRPTTGAFDGRESLERRRRWRSSQGLAFALALALPGVALAEAGGEEHIEVPTQRGTTGGENQGTATTVTPTASEASAKGVPDDESRNGRCSGAAGYAQTCYESGPDRSAYEGSGVYSQSHYQLGAGHED